LNGRQVAREIERLYPQHLVAVGIGGVAQVWVRVTHAGKVDQVSLRQSSGHPELDQIAIRVARSFRVRPASQGGCTIVTGMAFPITFGVS